MQTIDAMPGTSIETFATMLVARAPARGVFNDIELIATHGMSPGFIVTTYWEKSEARAEARRNSPEGKAVAAEQERRRAAAQRTVDVAVAALPALDFSNVTSVLTWVESVADAADRTDVTWDRDAVLETFRVNGWEPGANCNDDFDADDARNFAGWVVGQWLQSGYPMVKMFADQWRAKFCSEGT